MSNVGFATVTVIPSAKGFQSTLSGQTTGASKVAGTKGGKAFGGGFGGALKGVMGPLAAAGGAVLVGGFLKGAVSEASGLKESMNALNVVFGDSAEGVMALGKNAAKSVGMSNLQFNNLAVQFSSAAKNIAGPGGDVSKTLGDLTGRAADFASVMNIEVADAAALFQSGLAGESEPLRKYGIDVSAAAVNTFAYAEGIAKSGEELTSAQKQQAAYGLIMASTAQTQGDFSNTAGELANQQRILSASWADGKARLGAGLLPIVTSFVRLLNASLGPALDVAEKGMAGLVKGGGYVKDAFALIAGSFSGLGADVDLGPMTNPLIDFGATLRTIADAAKPILSGLGSSFSSLGPGLLGVLPLLNPVGLAFKALLPVLPQIGELIGNLAARIGPLLGPAIAQVVPLVGLLVSHLSGVLVAILPAVAAMVMQLAGALTMVVPAVMGLLGAIIPLAASLMTSLMPVIMQLVTAVLPILVSVFGSIVSAIAPLISILQAVLIPIIQALLPVVVSVFGALVPIITAAMKIVQGIIQVVTGLISGNWDAVWSGLGKILSGAWKLIVSLVSGAIRVVWSVIVAALAIIGSLWRNAWAAIGAVLSGAWKSISGAVSRGIASAIGFLAGLGGKARSALGNVGAILVSSGRNLVEGFMKGIRAVAGGIADAILKPIKGAVDGVKNFLGIHSPSRLFMQIGGHTAEGMAIGITKGAKGVQKAALALVPPAPSFRSPDVTAGRLGAGAEGSGSSAGPLIGSLTLQSSGSVREDLEETMFHVRRIARGGLYA